MLWLSLWLLLMSGFGMLISPTLARSAESDPIEEYVWGQQPTSAATEQTRWAKDLELRPSNTPSDVMRLTPSLMIGQRHGGGTVLSRRIWVGLRTKKFGPLPGCGLS